MGILFIIYSFLLPTAIILVFVKTAHTSTSCIQWNQFVCPQGMKPTCISTTSSGTRKTITVRWHGVSTSDRVVNEPCPPGLLRQPNGKCPEHYDLSSRVGGLTGIRAPCPRGTRADQYGKCRQLLS